MRLPLRAGGRFAIACGLGTLILSLAMPVWGAEKFEKLLPEGSLVVLQVKHVPNLIAKIKKSPGGKLLEEAQVKRFLEQPRAAFTQWLIEAEGQAGFQLAEIQALFQGQVALALTALDFSGRTNPEVVALIEVGQNAAKARDLMARVINKVKAAPEAKGITVLEGEFAGQRLTKILPPPDKKDMPSFAYSVANDILVLGTPATAVERLLAALEKPPAESLAGNQGFQHATRRIGQEAALLLYVNLNRLLAGIPQIPGAQAAWPIVTAVGLDNLLGFSAASALQDDSDMSRYFLHVAGQKRGVIKIITPQVGELFDAKNVPPDAASFFSARYDIPTIFQDVVQLIRSLNPQMAQQFQAVLDKLASSPQGGLNIQKEVVPLFGPRFAFYSRYTKPYNMLTSQQVVFIAEIRSKEQFDAVMDKVRTLVPPMAASLQTQEYLGHKLYVFTQQPGAQAQPQQPMPAYVALTDRLVISNQVEGVKEYLRYVGKEMPTLADSPAYKENLSKLPADSRAMIGFHNPVPQAEFFLTVLKDPGTQQMIQLFMDKLPPVLQKCIDFSLLPEPAVVTKYLAPSATVAQVLDDGILIQSYSSWKMATPAVPKQ